MRQRPLTTAGPSPAVVAGLVPRFYLGVIFAIAAEEKLKAPGGYVAAVTTFLHSAATLNAPPWFQSFLTTSVLPHVDTYATAVVGAEIFVAASLLTGLLTRVGAVVAIYLLVNYLFAKGSVIWNPGSNDAADIMLAFVVLMTGPGRIFGLDALLAAR